VCTYQTETLSLRGSGKGPQGWFSVTDANVFLGYIPEGPLADGQITVTRALAERALERVAAPDMEGCAGRPRLRQAHRPEVGQ